MGRQERDDGTAWIPPSYEPKRLSSYTCVESRAQVRAAQQMWHLRDSSRAARDEQESASEPLQHRSSCRQQRGAGLKAPLAPTHSQHQLLPPFVTFPTRHPRPRDAHPKGTAISKAPRGAPGVVVSPCHPTSPPATFNLRSGRRKLAGGTRHQQPPSPSVEF